MNYFRLPIALLVIMTAASCKTTESSRSKSAGMAGNPVQMARFDQQLQVLDGILRKQSDPLMAVDQAVSDGLRSPTFYAEALVRMYKHDFKDVMTPMGDHFKELEDQLGFYTDTIDYTKLAVAAGAPDEFIKFLSQYRKTQQAAFATLLTKRGWLDGSLIADIRMNLATVGWRNPASDTRYLLKGLQADLAEIETTKYDMTDLEGGLHHLRRQIRWFLLNAHALGGVIQLDKATCDVAEYKQLIKGTQVVNKWNTLDATFQTTNACFISQCLYLAVSDTNERLSDAKDNGQAIVFFQKMILEAKLKPSTDEAHALATALVNKGQPPMDYIKVATGIYDGIKKNRLAGRLREQIETCLNKSI